MFNRNGRIESLEVQKPVRGVFTVAQKSGRVWIKAVERDMLRNILEVKSVDFAADSE